MIFENVYARSQFISETQFLFHKLFPFRFHFTFLSDFSVHNKLFQIYCISEIFISFYFAVKHVKNPFKKV